MFDQLYCYNLSLLLLFLLSQYVKELFLPSTQLVTFVTYRSGKNCQCFESDSTAVTFNTVHYTFAAYLKNFSLFASF